MPFFKSTLNILGKPWEDEAFNPNWMDSNTLVLPPKKNWDYKRELQIEDINLWEVILEHGGGFGIYAAWDPYAEFYMVTIGPGNIETFYGKGAQKRLREYLKKWDVPLPNNKIWVPDDLMYLYE